MLQDGEKNAIIQKDMKTYAITPHISGGVTDAKTLIKIAEIAEKYNASLKITSEQRIAIIGLREEDIDAVWEELGMEKGYAVGNQIRVIKTCPGNTFCKRGKMDSLGMSKKLEDKFLGLDTPSKVKMAVSGCPNQCAENCIKDIGLYATGRGWRLTVGGNGGGGPRLAQLVAVDLNDEQAAELIDRILKHYIHNAKPNHRIGRMLDKLDFEEYKKEIIGDFLD